MADLEKFADDLSGEPPAPPYRISAGKLDRNFAACFAKDWDGTRKPYTIKRNPDGYLLQFPFWPPPAGGTYVLGSRGGEIVWLETQDCEE